MMTQTRSERVQSQYERMRGRSWCRQRTTSGGYAIWTRLTRTATSRMSRLMKKKPGKFTVLDACCPLSCEQSRMLSTGNGCDVWNGVAPSIPQKQTGRMHNRIVHVGAVNSGIQVECHIFALRTTTRIRTKDSLDDRSQPKSTFAILPLRCEYMRRSIR
jgi:hypothetical protein